jgi:ubiquinone/menaquinone biosynthesis C-methylase UbiE
MDRRGHWEGVYQAKRPDEVSWFQRRAAVSLELISSAVPDRETRILDLGGGASTLAAGLLAEGYLDVTVLDLASAGSAAARHELGASPKQVRWIVGDALAAPLAKGSIKLWHSGRPDSV